MMRARSRQPSRRIHFSAERAVSIGQLGMERTHGLTLTLYDLGSWGIRFNISVVFPLPKNPVIIVTGVGAMLSNNAGSLQFLGGLL